MTKIANRTSKKAEAGFQFPQFEMPAFNGDLFSAYAQASQAFFESAMALNQEIMGFANKRLQANAQRVQDLSKCACWEEAVAVQSDFAQLAATAYLAEIPTLTEQTVRGCNAMSTAALVTATQLPQAEAKT
jgi:hypothetical protein